MSASGRSKALIPEPFRGDGTPASNARPFRRRERPLGGTARRAKGVE